MIINIGDIFETNNYGRFMIMSRQGADVNRRILWRIKFLDTGFEKISSSQEIRKGDIKDLFKPTVCGVGYFDVIDFNYNKRLYYIWKNIISRCYGNYNRVYQSYRKNGVYVCNRWHSFRHFLIDVVKIDGWSEEKFDNREINLDKDYLQIGVNRKIYSKDDWFWNTHEPTKEEKELANEEVYIIDNDEYTRFNWSVVESVLTKYGIEFECGYSD